MTTNAIPAGTWTLDPKATTVTATAKNFMFLEVPANFTVISGQVLVTDSLDTSVIEFSLAADSFTTGNAKRDEHVRSSDFLDAEKYPSIDFRSDTIVATAHGYKVTGTLHLATSETTVTFDLQGVNPSPTSVTFEAGGVIDRSTVGVSKMPSFIIGNPIQVNVKGTTTLATT